MIDYTKKIVGLVSVHGKNADKKWYIEKLANKESVLDLYSKVCDQLLTLRELNKILIQIMSGKYEGKKTVDEFSKLIVNSVSAGNSEDYSYYSELISGIFNDISRNETSEDSIVKTKALVLTDFVNKWVDKNVSYCKKYIDKIKKEGKDMQLSRPKTASSGVSRQKTPASSKPEVSTEFPKNLPKEIPYDMGVIQGIFDSPVAPTTLRRFESMSTLGSIGNNASSSPRSSTLTSIGNNASSLPGSSTGGSKKPKKNIQKKKPSPKKKLQKKKPSTKKTKSKK